MQTAFDSLKGEEKKVFDAALTDLRKAVSRKCIQ